MVKQNYELAEEDYMNGMKYKEIAEKYNVSINTVKSWKTRYKWCKDKKSVHTKDKKVCTQNRKSAGSEKQNKEIIKEPIADEVKEVMENEELNDSERLFCVIYAKRHNATKAYQQVHHCTYWTAAVEGCKLLKKPKIKQAINTLIEVELNKEFLKPGLIQKYKDIAFSDIGDYLEFGVKQVPQWEKKDGIDVAVVDPNTGEQKINEYSYVKLKDSVGLDTSIISEVSEGKDGIKFKLADKMKAMDVLAKLSNLLSDEEKTQLDIEYKKLQGLKLKADIEKTKAETNRITGDDDIEIEDDGFMEALNGKTVEVWKNE